MTAPRDAGRWRWRLAALVGLAALYYAIPNARPDFTRFNAHDSESYLALSYSLTHGMGYTRSLDPERFVAHEMWPPGMAAILAPATLGADRALDWSRVKRTVATLGLLGLAPLWLWLRRQGGETAADVATLAVALNPFYWHFSHQAMAELPLFLWLVAGLVWIDQVWSRPRVSSMSAALAGFVCGLGMLIKGHVAGLALAPLPYLGAGGDRQSGRERTALWVVFCLAFALPFGAWLGRNATVDAPGPDGYSQLDQLRLGDPMDPDSESRNAAGSIAGMISNLRHHAIYHLPSQILPGLWPEEVFDWAGSGWPALLLTVLLGAAAWGRARPTRAAWLVVAFLAVLNLLYGYGGSPRFWVPISLLLLPLIFIRIEAVAARLPRVVARRLRIAVGLALAANLAAYIAAHERAPYSDSGPWAELAGLFQAIGERDLETNGVLAPNPHALQLISGVPAPMTYMESTYDHMVARTDGHGPRPPADARLRLAREPWALYELAEPTRGAELLDGPPRFPMTW